MFTLICALATVAFVGAALAYRFLDSSSLKYFLPRATLSVERVTVPIHGLPQRLDGLRVVQLSDIHSRNNLDAPTRALWARAVAAVRNERPDLVLVTGDLVDFDPTAIDVLVPTLQQLQAAARYGVYVILGNHDYHFNAGAAAVVQRALAAGSIPVLTNATAYPFRKPSPSRSTVTADGDNSSGSGGSDGVAADGKASASSSVSSVLSTGSDSDAETLGLALVGLGDLWGGEFLPNRVMPSVPSGVPRIVLSHNPDTAAHLRADAASQARNAARWGVSSAAAVRSDLILAGHTHGGQICFPSLTANRGAPVLGVLKWLDRTLPPALAKYLPGRRYYPFLKRMEWIQGLTTFQAATPQAPGSYLYVNRGLVDIYRRLFCDPELTVITLRTATDATRAHATAMRNEPPPPAVDEPIHRKNYH